MSTYHKAVSQLFAHTLAIPDDDIKGKEAKLEDNLLANKHLAPENIELVFNKTKSLDPWIAKQKHATRDMLTQIAARNYGNPAHRFATERLGSPTLES